MKWSDFRQMFEICFFCPGVKAGPGPEVSLPGVGVSDHAGKEIQKLFGAFLAGGNDQRWNPMAFEFQSS